LIQENFLHYLWKYKIFATKKLRTSSKECLQIFTSGEHNLNTGPDFFNAKIKINDQIWAGNIEIHVKASDWYVHHHEKDKNYDNVILHVVWINDIQIFHKNNIPIPTLELKNFVSDKILLQYRDLFFKSGNWINCENSMIHTNKFILNNWLEVLYIERLQQKSKLIEDLLKKYANDWEEVFFILLAGNFGLKVNRDSFVNLASSIDFKIIRKEQGSLINLEAILFGQAGYLNDKKEGYYYNNLKEEYNFLKLKYNLEPLFNGQFQFFRLRPNNFPTIRIAQLAMLYHLHQNLFSKIIVLNELEEYYNIFNNATSSYWKQHYNFNSRSKNRSKFLTRQFINLLLINTIIPLKYVYNNYMGKIGETNIFNVSLQIPVEKNTIVEKFSTLMMSSIPNFKIKNAMESQAILQLKSFYCDKQKCLNCAIGNSILNR